MFEDSRCIQDVNDGVTVVTELFLKSLRRSVYKMQCSEDEKLNHAIVLVLTSCGEKRTSLRMTKQEDISPCYITKQGNLTLNGTRPVASIFVRGGAIQRGD